MTPTPISVREHHSICLPPGSTVGTMRPFVAIPNQKLAQCDFTEGDKPTARVILGTASGTEIRYYNPSGSDDSMVSRQATFYAVRNAKGDLIATACTKREAWEVSKEAICGQAPKILLVNSFRGIESDEYDEILAYQCPTC